MSRRWAALITVVTLAMSAALAWRLVDGSDSSGSPLPSSAVLESANLHYDAAGAGGRLLMADTRVLLLPLGVGTLRGADTVLTAVEPARTRGIELADPFVVTSDGMMFPERGFPDHRPHWEPGSEQQLPGAAVLPAGQMVTEVLWRGELTDQHGYVKGFWVEGTEDGEAFRDFVDAYFVFCSGRRETAACRQFNNENSFAADRAAADDD